MDSYYGSGMILRKAPFLATFLLLTPALSLGATNTLSGGFQSRFSDNVRLDATNEEQDLENRVTLDFTHQNVGAACRSSADLSLGYGDWIDDSFEPEIYTNGTLSGLCNVTERFQWRASDRISQQTQDSREADTPENRTTKNVFSTGPLYTFYLSPIDRFLLSASYVNTEFEEDGDPDSNRVVGSASYLRNFSTTFEGGLTASAERTELDTTEELDRQSVSLNFNKTWPATRLNGSLGFNRLESRLGDFEQDTNGFTGNLGLARDINPTTEFSLSARRELTDNTSVLDVEFEDFSFDLTDSSAVEVTVITAGLRKRFSEGSSLSARAFADRSDYVQTDNREESFGVNVGYSRPVSPLTSLSANTSYRYNTFDDDNSDDRRATLSLGLEHRLSQSARITSTIGHSRKDSDVASRDYRENWVSVSLRYQFF